MTGHGTRAPRPSVKWDYRVKVTKISWSVRDARWGTRHLNELDASMLQNDTRCSNADRPTPTQKKRLHSEAGGQYPCDPGQAGDCNPRRSEASGPMQRPCTSGNGVAAQDASHGQSESSVMPLFYDRIKRYLRKTASSRGKSVQAWSSVTLNHSFKEELNR